MNKFITLLVALLIAACQNFEPAADQVRIERDKFGTPHIYAQTGYGVYFGYGYAVAQDRLFQMEMLKRTTQGKVSEVLGADFLKLDTLIRTAYDTRSVRVQIAALSSDELDVLAGYANGFNLYLDKVAANPVELLPIEFTHYDFVPSRWTAYDVAMLFVGSIAHRYSDFNSEVDNLALLQDLEKQHGKEKAWSVFNASKWLLDKDSPTTVPVSERPFPGESKLLRPAYLDKLAAVDRTTRVVRNDQGEFVGTTDETDVAALELAQLARSGAEFSSSMSPASNFWAVDSSRLIDADGALVNGPQFDWGTPSYVYGVGLHGGGFEVVGNTLLALPSMLFAHNNHVAWGSTAGLSDQVDLYVETLHPEDDTRYLHDGKYLPFDAWTETIKVRGESDQVITARRTVHGMVESFDSASRSAISRARAWEGGELSTLMAWVFLPKDKTLDAVQKRLAGVTTNINFYYMDDEGNLGYTHGGRYPVRASGHDSRLPASGTGEYDWQGYRPYTDNPTTRNPQQGYIANWNNRPSADWISIDLWSYNWARGDRARLLFDELETKPKFEAEEIWRMNDRLTFADVSAPFILSHLEAALEGRELTGAQSGALKILRDWDQQWLIDGDAYYGAAELIMESWLSELLESAIADDIGPTYFPFYAATNNPNRPLGASMGTAPGTKSLIAMLDDQAEGSTPAYDFFNGSSPTTVLSDVFVDTINSLVAEHGTDLSAWKLKAAPMVWKPNNFRGVPQALDAATFRVDAYLNRGSENNYFVAKDGNITGYDVVPPGQSGFVNQAGEPSKHHADQMEMFTSFELKPLPFTPEQVKQLSVSTETINATR